MALFVTDVSLLLASLESNIFRTWSVPLTHENHFSPWQTQTSPGHMFLLPAVRELLRKRDGVSDSAVSRFIPDSPAEGKPRWRLPCRSPARPDRSLQMLRRFLQTCSLVGRAAQRWEASSSLTCCDWRRICYAARVDTLSLCQYDAKTRLESMSGSTSISSDDLFGDGSDRKGETCFSKHESLPV